MKRIVIGRANDSDIVIPDEHDNVSRHHAVISFNFFGRMTLSDTSSNGTLINGTRMLKGASIPVTRNDKIQLGGAWIFDWNLVEDPYRKVRHVVYALMAVVVLLSVGLVSRSIYVSRHSETTNGITIPKAPDDTAAGIWNSDSTENVAPTETSIPTPQTQKKVETKGNKSKKSSGRSGTNTKKKKTEVEKPLTDDDIPHEKEHDVPVIN